MDSQSRYKSQLAISLATSEEKIHLYWKGRVALYAALKAIGVGEGDEVIVQAFTCVVVPNAVIYLGATPIYVDINRGTYNTDLDKIKSKISSKTKAVIVQNTFGLSSDVDVISAYCRKINIPTIEDCTHGFGGTYNGELNGSYCDFAFFSTQWNKPFSTGVGGILQVNNSVFLKKIDSLNKELEKPSLKETVMLKLLLFAHSSLLSEGNYWSLVKFYRWLSKKGIVVGSSDHTELIGANIPENYFKASSAVQGNAGIHNLKSLKQVQEKRKALANKYTSFLIENRKKTVDKSLFGNHSFLKYPILVKNRSVFMELAEKNKIKLGEWFISPIHPIEKDYEKWGLKIDDFPNANELSKQVINLPTDAADQEHILNFLKNNLDYII